MYLLLRIRKNKVPAATHVTAFVNLIFHKGHHGFIFPVRKVGRIKEVNG